MDSKRHHDVALQLVQLNPCELGKESFNLVARDAIVVHYSAKSITLFVLEPAEEETAKFLLEELAFVRVPTFCEGLALYHLIWFDDQQLFELSFLLLNDWL